MLVPFVNAGLCLTRQGENLPLPALSWAQGLSSQQVERVPSCERGSCTSSQSKQAQINFTLLYIQLCLTMQTRSTLHTPKLKARAVKVKADLSTQNLAVSFSKGCSNRYAQGHLLPLVFPGLFNSSDLSNRLNATRLFNLCLH